MERIDKDIFEGVVELVSAALEESEVKISSDGGEQVADFFTAIYNRIAALDEGTYSIKEKGGKFTIFKDADSEYHFCLKAANNEVIAESEGYKTKVACLKGIESVRKNAATAALDE